MTDDPQHTTDELGTTDQTDDAETENENADARLDTVEQRVEDHQAILDGLKDHLGGDGDGIGPVTTRRGVLTAGGVLGLLGLGAGTASADASGQVGTNSDPLKKLYTKELNGGVTGDKSLTNIAGQGLTIDGSGNLKTSGGSSTSKLETSTNTVTAMEVLDGSSSVSASSDGATPPNILGGHPSNNTGGSTVKGVTISGGGGNSASSKDNTASANFATIGGGNYHLASKSYATIAGGNFNKATASNATVGGGTTNEASGSYATIPGGNNNLADGDNSFAAGRFGETNGKKGAFVWGDSSSTKAKAQAEDEVRFQASGGFVITNRNGTNESVTFDNGLPSGSGDTVVIDGSGQLKKTSGGSSTSELETSGNTALEVFDASSTVSDAGSSIDTPNVVGGHPNNNTGGNTVKGVTISGGGSESSPQKATARYTTIGGGYDIEVTSKQGTVSGGFLNKVSGLAGTIGGGKGNDAKKYATVGGGEDNQATSDHATVAGGNSNEASGISASVLGGGSNGATGTRATIGGGYINEVSGDYATIPGGKHGAAASNYTFVLNDGDQYTDVPHDSTQGLSSDNAVDGESVTGKRTFSAAAKNGFRLITGGSSNPSVVTVDDDGSDARLQTHSYGLKLKTNDNGNLTLDPGSNKELQLSNQSTTSSDDSLLAIDGSGNVKKASSTTLNDVGSGGSKWADGSSGGMYLEPSGGDTKLEGIELIESNDEDSAMTITQDTNESTGGAPKDLTLETVDTGSSNYPGDIILDADPNANDSRKISFKTGGTEHAKVDSNGLTATNVGLTVAPSTDDFDVLDVQDKDGNSVLQVDSSAHNVAVNSGDNSASMDLLHDNTNAEITTTTGKLKLKPSSYIDLAGNNVEDGTTTVYSKVDEHVVRSAVDINRKHVYASPDKIIDADHETVEVDTSQGSSTIDLKDTNTGHNIRIVDTAGNASTNNISFSPHGNASTVRNPSGNITTDYGYRVFEYDGNGTWYEVGSN